MSAGTPLQQVGESSGLITQVSPGSPAIDLTGPRSAGTEPASEAQQATESSALMTHARAKPIETPLTGPRSAGGKRAGSFVSPQHCSWSPESIAHVASPLTDTAFQVGGGVVAPARAAG